MSEPLEFRIIQNLQTALRAISVANGYHHDIAAFAVKLDPDQDVESLIPGDEALRPFMILALSPDAYEYVEKPIRILLRMPFIIHVVHNTDPKVDDSKLLTYLRLCADVETAIAIDIERGALATDTRIFEREMHELAGQQVWAMVKGEIREHRTYGAPNG